MDETTGWTVKALLVIFVFVTIFAVVDGAASDLGPVSPVLAVLAGLGALAALFGALKMAISWAQ